MRTPSPTSETYRHEVQTRVQNLLSGQRPRHPVLSQHSTGRLILEGVVEELRIYRLKKEQEILRSREEGMRTNNSPRKHGGRDEQRGKGQEGLGCRGISDDDRDTGHGRRSKVQDHRTPHDDRRDTPQQSKEQDKHDRPRNPSGELHPTCPPNVPPQYLPYSSPNTHHPISPRINPISPPKRRLNRHATPSGKAKWGRKDVGHGPFPTYTPKLGPMLGLGDHLKDRYTWGVENYKFEERKRERRERRKAEKEVARDNEEVGRGNGKGGERDGHVGGRDKLSTEISRYREGGGQGSGRLRDGEAGFSDTDPAFTPYPQDTHDRSSRHTPSKHQASPFSFRRPDIRGGKSHTSSISTRATSKTPHESPPVYKATRHSRHVEARERAEEYQSKGQPNAEYPREVLTTDTEDLGRKGVPYASESRNIYHDNRDKNGAHDVRAAPSRASPSLMNPAVPTTKDTKSWSNSSKVVSSASKYGTHGREDEQYFSSHASEERKSRSESIRSSKSTLTSRSLGYSESGT